MKKNCFHQDMRTRERLMIINKTGMSDMNLFSKCFALTKQRHLRAVFLFALILAII